MGATVAMGIRSPRAALAFALAAAWLLGGASCGGRPQRIVTCEWWVGRSAPAFDPLAPRDAVRWSLERLLNRGLVDEDESGRIVPAAAERVEFARDSLTVAFHLRRNLRFTNGTPCRSADFRAALERGIARTDHAAAAWALSAVRGVEQRGGRAEVSLGIRTPDDSTLVLELARRDPQLLRKLALPPFAAWHDPVPEAGWKDACGIGPYRVLVQEPRHLVLVRARGPARAGGAPDTVSVRFETVASRLRAAMRAGRADLLWPVPEPLLIEPLPAPYRHANDVAYPPLRLLLVMRSDVPPASRPAARHALAHGLDRSEVADLLGNGARDPVAWWRGGSPFEYPKLDAQEVAAWLERGRLGRSFHAVMLLDAEGGASGVARSLQGEWARLSLSVDLLPLRGEALAEEAMKGWKAQLILTEWQPPIADPAAELAMLVTPSRGPAVGPLRTGWRTRELDPWIRAGVTAEPLDLDAAQRRLAEQLVALPIADLDWTWVVRTGVGKLGFHPHFGPEVTPSTGPAGAAR